MASTGTADTIENKGSDTMVNLALAWAEAYRGVRPEVSIAVTGGGSGTGIAALLNGTVEIANASRPMKEDEIAAARAKGIEPVERVVAVDALAVIVHPQNPIHALTIDQLSDLFTGRIRNWRELRGEDRGGLVSRETNRDPRLFLEEVVPREGRKDVFAPSASSTGITSEVSRNPNAIGYDGLATSPPGRRWWRWRWAESPSSSRASSRRQHAYPARPLIIYSAGEPG